VADREPPQAARSGQHGKAIETAQETERLRPGRYETAANLGTFYFHAGKLEEGIPHIDRALKINPDAHFGREKYQKLLVQYVIAKRKGGPLKLPLAEVTGHSETGRENSSACNVEVKGTFAGTLLPREHVNWLTTEEAAPAIKGILGMMKFGKHDAPVLLEALGTLLTQGEEDPKGDAKQLAARAFLRASYEVPEGPARVSYRRMAARALYMQVHRTGTRPVGDDMLAAVELDFQKELEEARAWYADLHERELSWIRDGKDPEAEFDKLYETDPEVSGMNVKDPLTPDQAILRALIILAVLVGAGALSTVAIIAYQTYKQERRKVRAVETARIEPGRTDAPRPAEPS
jgi:tetratricopeptide (TPR) repeat protein